LFVTKKLSAPTPTQRQRDALGLLQL
jgi:hypothetical protein